ncbi:MAG TPA: diguanylate cyclase [Thermoanaerobaculia bacterium]|nr:diguanylate cyclase [Thermoanaerobaculia bacterium]
MFQASLDLGTREDSVEAETQVADLEGRQLALLNEIARIASEDIELQPMLQRITDALAVRFGWELVALIRIDGERSEFVCEALTTTLETQVRPGYRRALGSGVVGRVASTGQAILLDDVREADFYVDTLPDCRSELCLPIKHRGEVVALLNLESPRLAAFAGQLPMLETVAEQVAGVIASARLYEEARRRTRDLEILSEVYRRALEGSELTRTLDAIAREIRNRLGFDFVSIGVLSEDGSSLDLQGWAAKTSLPLAHGYLWPVDKGILGRALRDRKPQLVFDVDRDPDYVPFVQGVKGELAVPILFRDNAVGSLNVETARPEELSQDNVRLLAMLADQIAGALHLALVNRRLEEANQRLVQTNEALSHLSLMDALTGVSNRRHFEQALDLEWRRAYRERRPLALAMVDIDHFKAFNDAYGHQAGDDSLRRVAQVLSNTIQRAGDLVSRYGGEEFAVILPGLDAGVAANLCEQLRARVEQLGIPHGSSTTAPQLTISAGVAGLVPQPGQSSRNLVAKADNALYLAKSYGRNRVVRAPDD